MKRWPLAKDFWQATGTSEGKVEIALWIRECRTTSAVKDRLDRELSGALGQAWGRKDPRDRVLLESGFTADSLFARAGSRGTADAAALVTLRVSPDVVDRESFVRSMSEADPRMLCAKAKPTETAEVAEARFERARLTYWCELSTPNSALGQVHSVYVWQFFEGRIAVLDAMIRSEMQPLALSEVRRAFRGVAVRLAASTPPQQNANTNSPTGRAADRTSADQQHAEVAEVSSLDRLEGPGSAPRVPAALTEFLSGARGRFDSKGHAKARGIHLTLQYPASWRATEGERPHVVRKISAKDDTGLALVAVLIIREAPPGVELVLDDLYSDASLREMGENAGGRVVASGRTKLEGEPAGWTVMTQSTERAGMAFELKIMTFMVIHNGSMVQLQFTVAGPAGTANKVGVAFDANKPLFQQIANSLVFLDKWK